MKQPPRWTTAAPPYLDKLAQNGTDPFYDPLKADFANYPFEKIQTDNRRCLTPEKKRANAKYFSRYLQNTLFYGCPDSDLRKAYLNTYYCTHAVEIIDAKEFTTYCKNRWCLSCARIKTGIYINDYMPQILEMPAPQLITLTRRNIPGVELRDEINDIIKQRIKIINSEKKHRSRNKLPPVKALFKIEVTYNEHRDDFHPHIHGIVQDSETASRLIDRWMSLDSNRGKVARAAQDIRPVLNEYAAKELFKYFTKLLSKDRETGKYKIYPATVLDTIFKAMRRRQVYTPYGLVKPEVEYNGKTIAGINLDDNFDYFFLWKQSLADWVEQTTGELLSGNKPSELIKQIFQ